MSGIRHVLGLYEAEKMPEWPAIIPRPRPRGIKALGTRYEKLVAKQLPYAQHGVWWQYRDSNGRGLCQTDFLLDDPKVPVILECKHTWTAEGMEQLEELYIPVVSMALGRPAIGIQVCKHLVPWAKSKISYCLSQAILEAEGSSSPVTLHWRGLSPFRLLPEAAE